MDLEWNENQLIYRQLRDRAVAMMFGRGTQGGRGFGVQEKGRPAPIPSVLTCLSL